MQTMYVSKALATATTGKGSTSWSHVRTRTGTRRAVDVVPCGTLAVRIITKTFYRVALTVNARSSTRLHPRLALCRWQFLLRQRQHYMLQRPFWCICERRRNDHPTVGLREDQGYPFIIIHAARHSDSYIVANTFLQPGYHINAERTFSDSNSGYCTVIRRPKRRTVNRR